MQPIAELFDNQRETNLLSTTSMVEDVLVELGHFVNQCREDPPLGLRSWRFRRGSALIRVAIIERKDFPHLRVSSTALTLDDRVDRAALFGHLLELNCQLAGVAFAASDDQILVVAERSTLDLDRSEVLDLIGRVSAVADDHDDALVARFGGSLGGLA